jgi:hypothetical protein
LSVFAGICKLFSCIQIHQLARHFMHWKIISNKIIMQSKLLEALSTNFHRMAAHRLAHYYFYRWIRNNHMRKALLQRFSDKLVFVKHNRSLRTLFYR